MKLFFYPTLRAATLAGAAALAASLGAPALADTIIMKNGRQLEGVAEDDPADPSVVVFHAVGGVTRIPKADVANVRRDSPADSWIALGDQFMARDRVDEAREAFERAVQADPRHSDAQRRLSSADAELRRGQVTQAEQERLTALNLIDQSRALVEEKKFEEALGKIQAAETRAGALVAAEAIAAKADLYYKWGLSSLDRLNNPRAAQMFEEALRLSPGNPAYRDALITAYEKLPEKKDEVLTHHRARLQSNPADVALRHKVARMLYDKGEYSEAANLLLLSADQKVLQTEADREMLEKSLQQVVTKATDDRNFQQARDYYARLMQFYPGVYGPGYLHYYDYYIKANATDQKNPHDLMDLARFAAERRLDVEAKINYSKALALSPDLEDARRGLSALARQDVEEARAMLAAGQYQLASAMALKLQEEYPRAPDILEEARIIQDKASILIEEAQRRQTESAKTIALQGDEYYQRAMSYMAELRNTEFTSQTLVYSPKQEAIRNLQRAILAWQQALRIDPSLGTLAGGDLNTKLADAQRHYASLTGPVYVPRGWREIRGLRDDQDRGRIGGSTGGPNPPR